MGKFVVNGKIPGYAEINIASDRVHGNGHIFIIIVNSRCPIKDSYSFIKEKIMSNNKIILIGIKDINRTLAYLMASYKKYDIYVVDSELEITANFANSVASREPSFSEIETYVGADITCYAEVNTILLGIENLVKNGDIKGLEAYVSRNLNSILKLSEVYEALKYQLDNYYDGGAKRNTKDTDGKLEEALQIIEEYKKKLEKAEEVESVLQKRIAEQNAIIDEAEKRIEALNDPTNRQIIKRYTEINTSSIKCKPKIIIYFKEITQIPYINSMVTALVNYIGMQRLKVKLLIYDNKSYAINVYKPLTPINGTEYLLNKEQICSQMQKVLIEEPNQAILDDILKLSTNPYDVVIVYDRMRQLNDLVVGNNVYKFYIVNSSKDFKEARDLYKITDTSWIITRTENRISNDYIDIPFIPSFSEQSDPAKTNKYMKAIISTTQKPLLDTILSKTRVNLIVQN